MPVRGRIFKHSWCMELIPGSRLHSQHGVDSLLDSIPKLSSPHFSFFSRRVWAWGGEGVQVPVGASI
jgi:hypothetical protein